MKIEIDWIYILAGALGAVGAMEYAKGLWTKAPKWIWKALLPVAAAGVAYAGDGGTWQMATNGVLILAVAQISYKALIEAAKKKVA